MVLDLIRNLEKQKAKLARLEAALVKAQAKKLAGLPAKFGFDSLESFIEAVRAAGGRKSAGSWKKPATSRRRKRAKITDAVREKVIAGLKAGRTGDAVAKEAGISLPSVQNIKKAAGLVKGRSKAAK